MVCHFDLSMIMWFCLVGNMCQLCLFTAYMCSHAHVQADLLLTYMLVPLFWSSSLCYYSYVPNPVLVIIDVQPKELGIPTKAYYDVEEVKEVRTASCAAVLIKRICSIDIYIVCWTVDNWWKSKLCFFLSRHVHSNSLMLNLFDFHNRMLLRKAKRFSFMCPQKLLLTRLRKLVNNMIKVCISC